MGARSTAGRRGAGGCAGGVARLRASPATACTAAVGSWRTIRSTSTCLPPKTVRRTHCWRSCDVSPIFSVTAASRPGRTRFRSTWRWVPRAAKRGTTYRSTHYSPCPAARRGYPPPSRSPAILSTRLKAVVADDVPLDDLVRRWGATRNSIYKLLHDARRKLKSRLEARGFAPREMLALFSGPR